MSTVELALTVSLVFPLFGWRSLGFLDWALIAYVAPVDFLFWLCFVYFSEVTLDVFNWEFPATNQAQEAQILLPVSLHSVAHVRVSIYIKNYKLASE